MFKVQYRYNGEWFSASGQTFKTKALAKQWAENNHTCKRNGYQIIKAK